MDPSRAGFVAEGQVEVLVQTEAAVVGSGVADVVQRINIWG